MPSKSFQQRCSSFVQNQGLSLGFILALTALVFSNVFQNDFARDDFSYILNWPLIQNLLNLPRFFVGFIPPEGQAGLYAPLKTFWHALLYFFFTDNPSGYHVVALVIHLVGVMVVYRLALVLTAQKTVAFLTALLFSLHPVHVESVTFLSSSVDTAGIIFLLISFYCYIRAAGYGGNLVAGDAGRREEGLEENRLAYGMSLFFAVLAVFTHELALALPFLFLFFDLGFRGKKETPGKVAGRVLPFFGVGVVYLLLKAWNLGGVMTAGHVSDSVFLTMPAMIRAFTKYMLVLLLPTTLSYDHTILPANLSSGEQGSAALMPSFISPQFFLSVAVILGLAIVLALAYRRQPLVSFCVGWFLISLLPVPLMIPGPEYFAERYLYAASFAFCLLASVGFVRFYHVRAARPAFSARLISLVLVSGLVFFYAARTVLRNQDWKDEKTICETTVRSNPQNAALRYDLALVYFELGELDKALSIMKSAIALNPNDPYYYLALESIHSFRGEYKESIRALKKAVEVDPGLAEGYYNLAGIYAFLDFDDAARANLDKAIKLFKNRGLILEAGESALALEGYMATREAIKEGGAGLFLAPEH